MNYEVDTSNEANGNSILWMFNSTNSKSLYQISFSKGIINHQISVKVLWDKPTSTSSNLIGIRHDTVLTSLLSYVLMKDYYVIPMTPLSIDTLTVSQMDYYYEKYLEYKEIEAIQGPPLDVNDCYPAAGCYTYFELGRLMFNDGLLSMIPREINGNISFPIFTNLFQLAKNGALYLFVPMLNFLSDFVPFIEYDNSDIVYTNLSFIIRLGIR